MSKLLDLKSTNLSTSIPIFSDAMARYYTRTHAYPHLFKRIKSFIEDNHLDKDSLSILNEVDGGYYDFTQSGYSYSFGITLKYDPPILSGKAIDPRGDAWVTDTIRFQKFYVTIECKHDSLRGSEVFGLTIMETWPCNTVLCNSIIFNDNLVRKQIEHTLSICLLPF